MSVAQADDRFSRFTREAAPQHYTGANDAEQLAAEAGAGVALRLPSPGSQVKRERFIPITRFALIDRLTHAQAWPRGQAIHARRFFRYL